ncbi:hypothetical protein [Dactylosporangium matsuzakiense]|uniref:MFS transporter n=1 Tax=Dactylosporangium matsuzakiense TaxID=53360 RepID=A0A9W6NT99_9ACTN|nr:hypothetical protein [Dactylosporangium matsuzakiense]UWZ41266.1 hypothetical protein Dmats_26695 [Dactylosporangium matsuzakiense]GLL08186.1 hypothetical protein GCM10017581_099470 [Dactylosporangium matsuzakiense]
MPECAHDCCPRGSSRRRRVPRRRTWRARRASPGRAGRHAGGGLGLGLSAPILVNVVLAGVPGRRAGAAGGVLSTVNQIGGAVGVALLGTVFFDALATGTAAPGAAPTGAADGAAAFGHALARVMPWQVATYLLAAAAMLALPRTAVPHQP